MHFACIQVIVVWHIYFESLKHFSEKSSGITNLSETNTNCTFCFSPMMFRFSLYACVQLSLGWGTKAAFILWCLTIASSDTWPLLCQDNGMVINKKNLTVVLCVWSSLTEHPRPNALIILFYPFFQKTIQTQGFLRCAECEYQRCCIDMSDYRLDLRLWLDFNFHTIDLGLHVDLKLFIWKY